MDVKDEEIEFIGKLIALFKQGRTSEIDASGWRRIGDYAWSLSAQAERQAREGVLPLPKPVIPEPKVRSAPKPRSPRRAETWHVLGRRRTPVEPPTVTEPAP